MPQLPPPAQVSHFGLARSTVASWPQRQYHVPRLRLRRRSPSLATCRNGPRNSMMVLTDETIQVSPVEGGTAGFRTTAPTDAQVARRDGRSLLASVAPPKPQEVLPSRPVAAVIRARPLDSTTPRGLPRPEEGCRSG